MKEDNSNRQLLQDRRKLSQARPIRKPDSQQKAKLLDQMLQYILQNISDEFSLKVVTNRDKIELDVKEFS